MKALPNRLRAIFIYSLETGKSVQMTDGMSDARSAGLRPRRPVSLLHRQHQLRPDHQRAGHVERRARGDEQHLPRRAAEQHPVAAGAGERRGEARRAARPNAARPRRPRRHAPARTRRPSRCASTSTRIQQRIVALPIPARAVSRAGSRDAPASCTSWKPARRRPRRVRRRRDALPIRSQDAQAREARRRRGLIRPLRERRQDADPHGSGWRGARRGGRGAGAAGRLRSTSSSPPAAPVKPGEGALKLADVEVNVDPLAEWKQMYHEVWRIEKSYFYDPEPARRERRRFREGVREVSRFARLALGPELHLPEHAQRDDGGPPARRRRQRCRRRGPFPAACSAPTTRSPTAAIASSASTPARAGTRSCRARSPRPG